MITPVSEQLTYNVPYPLGRPRDCLWVHADVKSFPIIRSYGQNTLDDWWHPVTRFQFEGRVSDDVSFQTASIGDPVRFNIDQNAAFHFAGVAEAKHIERLYGPIGITVKRYKTEFFVRIKRTNTTQK